ncbi:MAG TPA: hypothetical protein EYH36_03980, partial [Desulfocapsa sulfexigens]|nr:hypothetical protein [Desulfocapsa sulfexigens]
MKILLTDITTKNHVFNLEELIRFQDEDVELKADIRAKLLFSQQKDETYSLRGDLEAQVISNCVRCGDTAHFDVGQEFQYKFLLEEEPQVPAEYECTNE